MPLQSNTVNTLFWSLHYVLQQPTSLRELKQEITAARLKRREHDANEDFTIEELAEMRLLGKDNLSNRIFLQIISIRFVSQMVF